MELSAFKIDNIMMKNMENTNDWEVWRIYI